MIKYLIIIFILFSNLLLAQAPWSERMAATFIASHKDSILIGSNPTATWDYEQGLMMKALEKLWVHTGDGKYYNYIQKDIDHFINDNGNIRTYDVADYNLDNIASGHALLLLYQETGKEKYKKAAYLLRDQLKNQPRNNGGGFWHKKRYPYQMWLDGLYMAEPFYTEFAVIFKEPSILDDVAKQFALIEENDVDPKTGLLYHAYDEARQQKWANQMTGTSPQFWGRSMGWYAMALVDVLDYFPEDHPQRANLIKDLQRLMAALIKYQDKSGVWYQIVDQGGRAGNYLEASASSMYLYALLKGLRMGYLDAAFKKNAKKGYRGLLKNFVETDANGMVHLDKVVSVGGLGGDPYRDGSYEYYLSEPIREDDLKGLGPFIMASIEMEMAQEKKVGEGKKVGLDYYFNREYRKGRDGQTERFHYTWEDKTNSGFWLWGELFKNYGATLDSLPAAPNASNLKAFDVYIIVDPDTKKEATNPNFIETSPIQAITDWVKSGGVLVLMANDSANVELPHFNQLAKAFGIEFTDKSRNMVQGDQFEQGKVMIPAGHSIFKTPKKLYVKELSVLSIQAPAKASITEGADIIMATAKFGKGTVFAIGDPWLYNEYVNGKKIPTEYENFAAAKDLAKWLLKQAK